jgi:hypothetical protein
VTPRTAERPAWTPPVAVRPAHTLRRVTLDELPAVNDLYNRCRRTNRSLAEAEWLYAGNPYGEAIIFGAFDSDHQLIGMRPAIAHRFVWRDQERLAYQFVDAIVAPEHRNRGIFGELVRAISAAAARGDFGLFSFPNHNSLPIYRKTPWLHCLGRCEVKVKVLSRLAYARLKLGGRGLGPPPSPAHDADPGLCEGRTRLVPIRNFDCDFTALHGEVATVAASFTLRRREFLNWRYFGSPERQYHVALIEESGRHHGYVVMRLMNRIAHVMDVFARPERALMMRVFSLVSQWASRIGAVALYFNASEGNWFQRAFGGTAFVLRKKTDSIVLDRASVQRLAVLYGRPLDMSDFYFVMGDGDFF